MRRARKAEKEAIVHLAEPQPRRRPRYNAQGEKWCSQCKVYLAATCFTQKANTSDGLRSACDRCVTNSQLLRRFGITIDQFEELLEAQGGVCAICELPPGSNGRGARLCVDHDHNTGAIRGLLCAKCNAGLGSFDDERLKVEAAYLYMGKVPAIPADNIV